MWKYTIFYSFLLDESENTSQVAENVNSIYGDDAIIVIQVYFGLVNSHPIIFKSTKTNTMLWKANSRKCR